MKKSQKYKVLRRAGLDIYGDPLLFSKLYKGRVKGHRQAVNITMKFSPEKKDVLSLSSTKTSRLLRYRYGHLKKRFIGSALLKEIFRNAAFSLEKRLDSFLFRVGIVTSYTQARQLILHRKVRVNGRPINRPGYILNEGDFVCISPQEYSALTDLFFSKDPSQKFWFNVPKYILFDYKQFAGIYLYDPTLLEVPFPIALV